MIKYTIDDKTLVIPSGLGLGGQKSGSGGGVTPEEAAQIASAVTAEALDEYDTELQVDLEDIRDAVSGNSEDISTLSGVTETISQQIGSLSGLTDDIAAISGQTTANTQDIGILSGQTTANTADIAELSGVTEAIEGNLETVSGKVGEVYDAIFYEDGGETHSQIDDLWDALDEKQDLEAGSGISINDNVVSINPPGRAISLSETGRLQLNLGSGVTIGEDNELNLKIGDGLGFSGDTLVVSGGTGGGPTNYYLNDMSQQELADLYDMLAELTEYDNGSSNIPYIFENYRFFAHTADIDGQQYVQLFFSNWEEQDGDYQLWIGGMLPTKASYPVNVHRTIAIILSDGTLQMSDGDLDMPTPYKYYMYPDEYGGYSDGGSYTGVTHEFWANVWETSKSEGFDWFARKTLYIKINEGDVIPFRFQLTKTSGSSDDESTMVLYFAGQSIDYDTNTITVRKFNLTKDTLNDVYVPSALSTSTFTASS